MTFCVAGTAVLANAAAPKTGVELSQPLKVEQTLKQADIKEMTAPVSSFSAVKTLNPEALAAKGIRKAARKAAPESIVGKTFVASYNDSEDDYNSNFTVAAGNTDGEIVLEGFAGGSVKGTYDAETGRINIPVNVVIGQYGNYGDLTIYSLDSNGSYSRTVPITATVTENSIVFDNGIYAAVSAGGVFVMFDVEAIEANGSVSVITASKNINMPVYIKKTDETTVQIEGLGHAVISPIFTGNIAEAINNHNNYDLDSSASTLTGYFNSPISYYEGLGNLHFGMIISGYIYNPVFTVNVADNKTTLSLSQQGFIGYPNGASYSGQFITSVVISADFDIYALEVEEENPEEENPKWEDAGTATLIDGWVLPAFGVNQLDEDYWFEVPLQRHVDNENLYRLVDPYHAEGFAAKDLNESTKVGYIVFDATDPDHVVVNPEGVEAGFANSDLGITKFYCNNTLALYAALFGYEPSFIVSILGDGIPATTFKEGVLSLGYYDDPEYGRQYDANFGIQGEPTGGYIWTDKNNEPSDMTAYVLVNGAKLPSEPLKFEGNMTSQLDQNMGYGDELELNPAETFEVTADFDETDNTLTIYNFAELNPIKFNVDLTTGKIIAEGEQLSSIDDGDPDYSFTYYYGNRTTEEIGGVTGKIFNIEDDKTMITVDPWGEAMDYENFGVFFNNAYYNTVITLDGVIPGLEVGAPSLKISDENISYKHEVVDGAVHTTFNVTIVSEGLNEGDEVALYYTYPGSDDFIKADVPAVVSYAAGSHEFEFKVENLEKGKNYSIQLYAEAGSLKSDVYKYNFDTTETGVEGIEAENGEVRYFNLQGVKVNNPDKGVFVKVTGNKVEKVVK